jgi:hypothetical protein
MLVFFSFSAKLFNIVCPTLLYILKLSGLLMKCSIVIDVCAGFGYRFILLFEKLLDKLEG